MEFSELLKHIFFLKYIHLTVSQQYKLRKTTKTQHYTMTTDRFTKWPQFKHGHISLDNEQIHLQQKKKMVIFGSPPGTPPEPPWDPQTSPLTSHDLPGPQKDLPGTPQGSRRQFGNLKYREFSKKRQGFQSKLMNLGFKNNENVNISPEH